MSDLDLDAIEARRLELRLVAFSQHGLIRNSSESVKQEAEVVLEAADAITALLAEIRRLRAENAGRGELEADLAWAPQPYPRDTPLGHAFRQGIEVGKSFGYRAALKGAAWPEISLASIDSQAPSTSAEPLPGMRAARSVSVTCRCR